MAKCVLTNNEKKILEEIKNRERESDARMSILREFIENLKQRVEQTNKGLSLFL